MTHSFFRPLRSFCPCCLCVSVPKPPEEGYLENTNITPWAPTPVFLYKPPCFLFHCPPPLMSQMGSCRGAERRRDGDGSEESSHSTLTLRNLIQGMPKFAIGVVTTLVASYFATEIGQGLMTNPSTANFPPADMFAYSLLGLFSSSLASITFRRKLPWMASCFEDVTVLCFASTFASQLCILTPVRHHWIVFSLCLIPLLPLDGSPCVLLLRCFYWILRKVIHT